MRTSIARAGWTARNLNFAPKEQNANKSGERGDRRRGRIKEAGRVAAVDKSEGMRKRENFIGHRNRIAAPKKDTTQWAVSFFALSFGTTASRMAHYHRMVATKKTMEPV